MSEYCGFLDDSPNGFKLKATVQTYELSLADLAKLFSQQLGVPESRITITPKQRAHGDPLDRTPTTYSFDGIIVTVKAG